MNKHGFRTETGRQVTAVTAAEMREIDRVAVEEFDVSLLQMMENARRNLARHVREAGTGPVVVLAGNGGNGGGGGLCAARHLANRGVEVSVVLDRPPERLDGAERDAGTIVDALVGYGLDGPLGGTVGELVGEVERVDATVVSLDVPSGMVATTGERPGPSVEPGRVLTLALPKTGLLELGGDLFLGDIAIPAGVYHSLDVPYSNPFEDEYRVELTPKSGA